MRVAPKLSHVAETDACRGVREGWRGGLVTAQSRHLIAAEPEAAPDRLEEPDIGLHGHALARYGIAVDVERPFLLGLEAAPRPTLHPMHRLRLTHLGDEAHRRGPLGVRGDPHEQRFVLPSGGRGLHSLDCASLSVVCEREHVGHRRAKERLRARACFGHTDQPSDHLGVGVGLQDDLQTSWQGSSNGVTPQK